MTIRSQSKSPYYKWADECEGWRFVEEPGLSVIRERMPPNTAEVPHCHNAARRFFFVLEGELTITVAGKASTLRKSQGIEVAPGSLGASATETSRALIFSWSAAGNRLSIFAFT